LARTVQCIQFRQFMVFSMFRLAGLHCIKTLDLFQPLPFYFVLIFVVHFKYHAIRREF